uniref:glycoside hydrolase family 16 protein n=1 Tax=uncultured Pseudoalteromonas sp. TaxID=114053 RepID=UPI002634FCC6
MNRFKTHLTQLTMALSVATLAGCGGSATDTKIDTVNPTEPVSDWVMVWEDNFDGDAIDDKKWSFEINCVGGGNNEKQCYTDSEENAFIADGILNIVALPAEEGAAKPYTSARINTRYKADFKYGRFEVRAKLPSGQGSWPAFWMMPTDEVYGGWPRSGEIDIVESVNLKVPTDDGVESNIYGTLHYGQEWPNNDSSGKAYTFSQDSNPADDFHTYAIEWQEGEIRWYVDDYLYATQRQSELLYNANGEALALKHKGWYTEYFDQITGELTTFWDASPYDQEFYLILNFAVGGDWPENVNATGIDATAFENGQTFEVDYVRVYECAQDPDTGKGCETVRPGYDNLEDALVQGAAPAPTPPSDGTVTPLTIFDSSFNPNWPAWDCCGGTTPGLVEDADRGNVVEFSVGAEPTVNGFISRDAFITDENGEASP